MCGLIKKTDLVKQALSNGDYKYALREAKTFKMGFTKEESSTLSRGYDCLVHADFYKKLGKDCNLEIANAVLLLASKYSIVITAPLPTV